mgnify:CR=1 FL=1
MIHKIVGDVEKMHPSGLQDKAQPYGMLCNTSIQKKRARGESPPSAFLLFFHVSCSSVFSHKSAATNLHSILNYHSFLPFIHKLYSAKNSSSLSSSYIKKILSLSRLYLVHFTMNSYSLCHFQGLSKRRYTSLKSLPLIQPTCCAIHRKSTTSVYDSNVMSLQGRFPHIHFSLIVPLSHNSEIICEHSIIFSLLSKTGCNKATPKPLIIPYSE